MNRSTAHVLTDAPSTTRSFVLFPALRRWNLDSTQTAILCGILLVTVAVYLRCLANGFVYDDLAMVVNNRYIGQWSFIWKSFTRDLWWFLDPAKLPQSSFYHPLQNVWLGIAYHLFGTNPVGWHVLKIGLHVIVVVLSFRFAQLLTGSTNAAMLAALLFAVMPVHAEPVVWATDLPEPMSTAFELATLILFIRRGEGWRGMMAPLLAFAAASFSHEMAVVFPLLIGLYVFLFEVADEASITSRAATAARRCAPFFAISAIYMVTRAMLFGLREVLGLAPGMVRASLVANAVSFQKLAGGHSLVQVLLTIPGFLLCYLEVLLVPWLAGPAHNVQFVLKPELADFWVPLAILAILGTLAYLGIRRSSRRNLYLFCASWWLITLAPVLVNLDQVLAEAHDRYEYLGSFALCVVLGDLGVRVARHDVIRKRIVTALATALAVLYLLALWRIQPVWRDNISLFSRVVEDLPGSVHFHAALGSALLERGQLDAAENQYLYAIRLAPNDPALHFALAGVYFKMHRNHDAQEQLEAFYRAAFALKKRKGPPPHWHVEFH